MKILIEGMLNLMIKLQRITQSTNYDQLCVSEKNGEDTTLPMESYNEFEKENWNWIVKEDHKAKQLVLLPKQ